MKKLFIILFTVFLSCNIFAMEMYAGGVIGFDGHCGPYINHYYGSFSFEPHFGIYPFDYENIGIEASFRLVTKNDYGFANGVGANGSYKESYTALFVRGIYEFKPFDEIPELNIYAIAGIGLAFRKFEWLLYNRDKAWESGYYNPEAGWYIKDEPRTSLTFPLGAGARYQILDNLEAVAQAEFGAGPLLGFNLSVGLNYKF